MFAWGEDYRQSFRLKKGSNVPTGDGVQLLNFSFHIADLSAGRRVLAFIKANGEVSIIRTNENADGRRVRGKQKFVECKEKIEAVSCSDDEVTLLSERGTVFCVDTANSPYTPRPPKALCNIPVAQVACGSQHTLALTKGGQVYTWGQDSRGQLGLGNRNAQVTSPQQLRSLSAIPLVQITAGGEQSFALSVSGGVLGWGRNDRGQLGLGDTEDRHTPAPIHYLNMKKTVNISCGKDHAAFLTKDGAVFTCGSGEYGQLGHNSLQDELRPRLVAELWGAKVIKTACGRYHTLVLTDSMKVYSFGCNEQEQLGRGEESHPSVPLPVQMPQSASNGQIIENIYAEGDSSFATCVPNEDTHKGSNSGTKNKATLQPIENMIDKWSSECGSKAWKETKQKIHKMFSSASFLNQSFLDYRNDKHFQTSPNYSGLDLSLAKRTFKKLVKKDDVLAEVEAAVVQLLSSLDKRPVGVEGLRVFLILNELLCVMQKERKQSTKLVEEIAATVQKLPAESLQTLGNWWSSLLPSTMVKHVNVWKTALSAFMSFVPIPRNSVRNILLILQNMHNANRKTEIPEKTFCCEMNQQFLQDDLQLWRSMLKMNGNKQKKGVNDAPLMLCSFAFLMDLHSKLVVFGTNALWTQREHQNTKMVFMWPYGWVPQSDPTYFELRLRRASLLEDTFIQLSDALSQSDFKKPLVVYFDGDTKVTAVYKKDFFHHLFHNFLSTKSGMFMLNDSKTLAWFSSRATEEDRTNFFLLGFLCGLALYNTSIIHLSFPLALFKKLLDVEPTLEDMLEFSPVVGRSLQYIINYEDDDLENEYMDFSIDWDKAEVELDPQNPKKPVTSQNKEEFVDAYINYVFNTSVEKTFQEFKRGFFQVCDQDLVKLFQPEELREVLVGQDVYEWAKLKQNTLYDGSFYLGHPTVQMFWEVFEELTEDQKKDFLWFVTGSRRAPVLGMSKMRMKVREKLVLSGSHDQHFPESLTCHFIMELPVYSTKEIMRDRLMAALNPESGFWK
ncbi:probable E3 ubiquitin-protein ligase HERC3 [Melanotaenia boesemani]|uniref:probable E3 ubiquitin-protein ligase HERC3 n=1 Tax=Melanotaenia boesemani TaxID=1250792 RepID=UPI001C05C4B6|nr:probable E3 ubiquitin-protein ligase HERC3 [Melanotaenia boesemani]